MKIHEQSMKIHEQSMNIHESWPIGYIIAIATIDNSYYSINRNDRNYSWS